MLRAMAKFTGKPTMVVNPTSERPSLEYNKFKLVVLEGPEAGTEYVLDGQRVRIGSHPENDVVIPNETVSRRHCEIVVAEDGHRIRDLGSTNGTDVEGARIIEAYLHPGARITIGEVVLIFQLLGEKVEVPLSSHNSFGRMLGRSVPMRALFYLAEKVAGRDVTVLISGETGTGKGLLAEEIHLHSPRREKPFVVVDCSTIPAHLMESELFGHVKGAFTGAVADRDGAFAQADGGTIFFDEIGELPPVLQPKLLRVLEKREVKPVGQTKTFPVDVRIIAATNRNLKAEVAEGRFREDLYFRLSVVELKLPPLRERTEDIPLLAREFLRTISGDPDRRLDPDALRYLRSHSWPGNVRELHNVIERAVFMTDERTVDVPTLMSSALTGVTPSDTGSLGGLGKYSFYKARELAEREYLIDLLRRHDFNVSAAAKTAGIHRQSLHRLLRKHNLNAAELQDMEA